MKIEDNWLFAKSNSVKSAELESAGRTVYWLNGSAEVHNALTKQIGNDKTRQQGFERAVYALACDEKGKPIFKGIISADELLDNVDHSLAREYGMLILGYSKGDEKSNFESVVGETVKNSAKEKEGSTS